jgi:hypothetical protein
MVRECPLVRPPYPPALLERSRALLRAVVGLFPPLPELRRQADLALRRYPAYHAEIAHHAAALGVPAADVGLANLSYDLCMGLWSCSTLALATPDGPLVARNMDWVPEGLLARASCVTELPGGRCAGFVGATGVVTGLARAGFAVVLNAVPGRLDPEGFPVLLFLRRLLDEARSFDEAVRLTCSERLACSALITLAGTANAQRVCVERTAREHRLRWAEGDRPLVVTNHYRRLEAPDACPRYEYLERHAPSLRASPGAEELLALLRHDDVRQSITAQHVLACPATETFRCFVPAELLEEGAGEDGVEALRTLF